MRHRLQILLLLSLALVLTGINTLAADGCPSSSGCLICPPEYPIPCSNFNSGRCIYVYNQDLNCCRPTTGTLCQWYCC